MKTVTRLTRDGILFTNVVLDEITKPLGPTAHSVSQTTLYSAGFDEVTIQGQSIAKKELHDGRLMISGHFDEVTGIV